MNEDVTNFICEDCKDLLTQFYIFKQNAKQNLFLSPAFEQLRDFMSLMQDGAEPTIKIGKSQFVVSFDAVLQPELVVEETSIEEPYHEKEEECFKAVKMEIGGEDPFFEVETVNEEYEIDSAADQDFEIQPNSPGNLMKPAPKLTADKTYQCDCGFEASSVVELQKHMHQQHKRKSFNVNCCGVGFKDYKSFAIHRTAHENFDAIAPLMTSFSCSDCRVAFSCEDDIMTHLTEHHNETEGVQDVLIERRGAYEDHFLRSLTKLDEEELVEDNELLVTCGHCKKRMTDLEMKVHLLFFHTHIVFCPLDNRCFEGIKQVRLFSEHIRNKHPDIFEEKNLLYSCRHCKKSFATNFEKLGHMKLCDNKLFACENHCNKRFATEWLLKNHMKQVMGEERFSCETCGKRCVSRSDLQIHFRSHTNERPYSCPICHKSFKTSANRSSHLDIHESGKKHDCDVCGEKFQTRPILRKHKKKHDEKYQEDCVCKICERKYISKPHLLRHLKTSHRSPGDLTTDGMNAFFEEYFEAQGR